MFICDETKQPVGGARGKDVNQATLYCKQASEAGDARKFLKISNNLKKTSKACSFSRSFIKTSCR